jgi:hypothetical protein
MRSGCCRQVEGEGAEVEDGVYYAVGSCLTGPSSGGSGSNSRRAEGEGGDGVQWGAELRVDTSAIAVAAAGGLLVLHCRAGGTSSMPLDSAMWGRACTANWEGVAGLAVVMLSGLVLAQQGAVC